MTRGLSNSYSGYFRRLFGGRVQKLAVNAGFMRPNFPRRTGGSGCTAPSATMEAFTPSRIVSPSKRRPPDSWKASNFTATGIVGPNAYLVYFNPFKHIRAAGAVAGRVRRGARQPSWRVLWWGHVRTAWTMRYSNTSRSWPGHLLRVAVEYGDRASYVTKRSVP